MKNAKYKARGRAFINRMKIARGQCNDCGLQVNTYNTMCFAFDHRDPSQKFTDVSRMKAYAIQSIDQEISKCDLVCQNCHTLRTYYGRKYMDNLRGQPQEQIQDQLELF